MKAKMHMLYNVWMKLLPSKAEKESVPGKPKLKRPATDYFKNITAKPYQGHLSLYLQSKQWYEIELKPTKCYQETV